MTAEDFADALICLVTNAGAEAVPTEDMTATVEDMLAALCEALT